MTQDETTFQVPKWFLLALGAIQPFVVAAIIALFGWIISVERSLTSQQGIVTSTKELLTISLSDAARQRQDLREEVKSLSSNKTEVLTGIADIKARLGTIERKLDRDETLRKR